jgi:tetratricopeptide (TPR) repeat protein
VVLRKLKQEAGGGQAPQDSAVGTDVDAMPAPTTKPTAFVKKRVVRKVKEQVIGASGSQAELSELLRRADVLIEAGSSDEALSLLEAGVGKFGPEGDQTILCQIGGIYFDKGDLDRSSERFRQVVRMNPFNARAINNLGVILKKQRRYEESIRIINQAIEVDPNYERAWFELGCVFMEIEPPLLKEASIFLKRALELDPRFERAREQLKACTERMRKPS